MIHVRLYFGAAGRTALALNYQIVALDFSGNAVCTQHVDGRCKTIGLFDAQLLQAPHSRHAFRERRSHGQDGVFVDHGWRTLGRHIDAFQG